MNQFVQKVFETIIESPNIDTPDVCIETHVHITRPTDLKGPYLAGWLMKHERDSWHRTCEAVDELLQSGKITFSDDGELRATNP